MPAIVIGLGILAFLLASGGSATAARMPAPPPPPPPPPPPTKTPSGGGGSGGTTGTKTPAQTASVPVGAPPIKANGTLGNTGIPAGMFWGLPMDVIWQIDRAYAGGDPFLMAAAAERLKKYPSWQGLMLQIQSDAKRRSTPAL